MKIINFSWIIGFYKYSRWYIDINKCQRQIIGKLQIFKVYQLDLKFLILYYKGYVHNMQVIFWVYLIAGYMSVYYGQQIWKLAHNINMGKHWFASSIR